MPIYEFVCECCGRLEEHLQRLTDPPPAACPECQGKMAKIMSRNSFQLKGGGWYKDLYGSSPKSGASSTESTPASAASAPAPAASAPASSSAAAPAAPAAPAPASTPAASTPSSASKK